MEKPKISLLQFVGSVLVLNNMLILKEHQGSQEYAFSSSIPLARLGHKHFWQRFNKKGP